MTVPTILVLIIVVAGVLWFVSRLTMEARAKTILYAVIVVLFLWYLLSKTGMLHL